MIETMVPLSQPNSTHILVVEDEVVIARDIEDCLDSLGYSVLAIVPSGAEAIAKATELQPNLVLMDIRLDGDMDGIQAAEQIWGTLHIPVIYLTGFSDKSTLERAKLTRPFGYILKPVEERELYVAIETAMQQYQASQASQDREKWLATVLRDIGDAVIVIDSAGCVKFINLVATTLTGWTQAEAVNKTIAEVFHIIHEQTRLPLENPAIAAIQSGKITYLEEHALLISRSGAVFPIADSAAPLRDDNGAITGSVLVFRDITQRRLAEERDLALHKAKQLEQQMQELQRLDQLRDDFVSTVSHELRTPLANMKMAIQMLEVFLTQQGMLDPENPATANRIPRYFEILRNQCNQELNLVNNLLNLQHLNTNTYTIVPADIALRTWISVLAEGFIERMRSHQQQLIIQVAPDVNTIVSDEASLFRMLSELLNNACKYTPAGGKIILSVTTEQSDQRDGQPQEEGSDGEQAIIKENQSEIPSLTSNITICLTNTGVEIPSEELPRIFEEFYRIPHLDMHKQGGTGLGLALVKKLVSHLNGNIRAESSAGETRFVITLPLVLSEQLIG